MKDSGKVKKVEKIVERYRKWKGLCEGQWKGFESGKECVKDSGQV